MSAKFKLAIDSLGSSQEFLTDFIQELQTHLKKYPYNVKYEKHFEDILYSIISQSIGSDYQCNQNSFTKQKKYIDILLTSEQKVVVIELKVNKSAYEGID